MIFSLGMMTSTGVSARPARPARRVAILGGRCCAAVTARCQSRWIVGAPDASVRRDAEAALPEFARPPLADVAAELVLGPHELGVVVVAAHRPAAAAAIVALRELRAVVQVGQVADVEIVPRANV